MRDRWFGSPLANLGAPEMHSGEASEADLDCVFAGYVALDRMSNGTYGEFLRTATRCTRCRDDTSIPVSQQPINLLCGKASNRDGSRTAHEALQEYRRTDPAYRGSLRVNPVDGTEPLAAFLDQHDLAGLSIGHCGWGDLTARLRGAQLADGVDVMILGADWYPLTACSNFLLDRYHEDDHTLRRFVTLLRSAKPELPSDLGALFCRLRLYLGHTLLCYRTGTSKKGEENLSRRSFENCRDHLARHVDAVAPRVIVTFGREPARSIASIVNGRDAAITEVLARLRREPALKQLMQAFYISNPTANGIAANRNGREITIVPLCHPSMPNRYQRDYAALAALLSV